MLAFFFFCFYFWRMDWLPLWPGTSWCWPWPGGGRRRPCRGRTGPWQSWRRGPPWLTDCVAQNVLRNWDCQPLHFRGSKFGYLLHLLFEAKYVQALIGFVGAACCIRRTIKLSNNNPPHSPPIMICCGVFRGGTFPTMWASLSPQNCLNTIQHNLPPMTTEANVVHGPPDDYPFQRYWIGARHGPRGIFFGTGGIELEHFCCILWNNFLKKSKNDLTLSFPHFLFYDISFVRNMYLP